MGVRLFVRVSRETFRYDVLTAKRIDVPSAIMEFMTGLSPESSVSVITLLQSPPAFSICEWKYSTKPRSYLVDRY